MKKKNNLKKYIENVKKCKINYSKLNIMIYDSNFVPKSCLINKEK